MILALIWLHFLADFLLQTDSMATKKSHNMTWLSYHVLVYSLPFIWLGPRYWLVNMGLHWATDFASSRLTSKLWKQGNRHWFFVVIGADQAIHLTCLILTLPLRSR